MSDPPAVGRGHDEVAHAEWKEEEFESLFPGCDRGAMPPFGNLYKLPVYVDGTLAEHDRIVRLVKPKVGAFSGR